MGIGSLELKGKLFLAPLAGVTDKAFRRLCHECGAALVYSEMVSAKALCYRNRNTARLLEHGPEEGPFAVQLFGAEPQVMAEAVSLLAQTPDGASAQAIDVNMGCPVPKVVRNGEGSALMRDPDLAGRIIEAMQKAERGRCADGGRGSEEADGGLCMENNGSRSFASASVAAPRPITAKIRAGWDASSVNAVEMARTLEAAGADAICLHARTREQYYAGKADWALIAKVKAAVRIPVIGNGDAFSRADAARMMDQTGCDYVMVGRGALGNPWVFGPSVPTIRERAAMFARHARLAGEDKGERMAALEMRKHAGWYFKGVPGAAAFRAQANAIGSIDALVRAAEQFALEAEAAGRAMGLSGKRDASPARTAAFGIGQGSPANELSAKNTFIAERGALIHGA